MGYYSEVALAMTKEVETKLKNEAEKSLAKDSDNHHDYGRTEMDFNKIQDEAIQAMADAFCGVLDKHGIKWDGGTDGVFYNDPAKKETWYMGWTPNKCKEYEGD